MLYTMKQYTQQVAARVRAELAAQRKTQVDMSLATGIANSTLARRVAGTSPFTTDELAAVAEFLKVAPGFLAAATKEAGR